MYTIQPKIHTNKPLSDGSYSVKLYIYDDITEQTFWYPLGFSCQKSEWNDEAHCLRKNFPNYKKKNLVLKQKELQADEIYTDFLLKGERFGIEEFKRRMNAQKKKNVGLIEHYDNMIASLMKQAEKDHKKASSAKVWRETKNVLLRFIEATKRLKSITINRVDSKFLHDLENNMRTRGNNDNTIANRMRNLKRAWNILKKQGLLEAKDYPFQEGQYELSKQVKGEQNAVNPLNEEEIELWKNLDVTGRLLRSKLYTLGSYYLNGSNSMDLAFLKRSKNIKGERITFNRSKTGCLITVKITPEIQNIFDLLDDGSETLSCILMRGFFVNSGMENKDEYMEITYIGKFKDGEEEKLFEEITKISVKPLAVTSVTRAKDHYHLKYGNYTIVTDKFSADSILEYQRDNK